MRLNLAVLWKLESGPQVFVFSRVSYLTVFKEVMVMAKHFEYRAQLSLVPGVGLCLLPCVHI